MLLSSPTISSKRCARFSTETASQLIARFSSSNMRLTSRYLWLEPINNARRRLVEFAVRVRRNALL